MAENIQPWSQSRQGYRPGPQNPQRMSYPGFPQPAATNPQGMNGLTREERQEAKRLAEEANFNFSGYQVVRREFISHRFDPAMTIRGNSITFNNSCISKLEDATYIQFLINPEERKLAIRPCEEGARDAVRWCVVRGDKRKSREITCRPFTTKLYELMGWEQIYRYKLQGIISLTANEKPWQNASRSPKLINSVRLSLIFSSIAFCCSVSVADNSCS